MPTPPLPKNVQIADLPFRYNPAERDAKKAAMN